MRYDKQLEPENVGELRRRLTDLRGDEQRHAAEVKTAAKQLLAASHDPEDKSTAHRAMGRLLPPGSPAWQRHYRQALEAARVPQSQAVILREMGVDLVRARRWRPAIDRLAAALVLHESFHPSAQERGLVFAHLAQAYRGSGNYNAADEFYKRASQSFRSDRLFLAECEIASLRVSMLESVNSPSVSAPGYPIPGLDAADNADEYSDALYRGAVAYRQLGDDRRATEILEEVRRHLGPGVSLLLANVINQLGGLAVRAASDERGDELHRTALRMGRRCSGFSPSREAQVLTDLAFALMSSEAPETDEALHDAGDACDRADAHGFGTWAWSELARRRLTARPATEDEVHALAAEALWYLNRAERHAWADPDERRFSGPALAGLEAQALHNLGQFELAADSAIRAARLAADQSWGARAQHCISAAHLLLTLGRFYESRQHTQAALSVLGNPAIAEDELQQKELRREAELLDAALCLRSGDPNTRARGAATETRLLNAARSEGDHEFAGRLLNATTESRDEGANADSFSFPATLGSRAMNVVRVTDEDVTTPPEERDPWTWFLMEFDEDASQLTGRAESLVQGGDMAGAIHMYERALAHQLRHPGEHGSPRATATCEILLQLVSLRLDQGDGPGQLLRLIERGLSLSANESQLVRLLSFRGLAQFREGAFRLAIESYSEAINALPPERIDERASYLNQIAESNIRLGQWQAAISVLDEADALPLSETVRADVLQTRASREHALGRSDRAAALLRQAVGLLGDDPAFTHARAMCLVDLAHTVSGRDPAEGVGLYEQAIELIELTGDQRHIVPAREGRIMAKLRARQVGLPEAKEELDALLAARRRNGDYEGELATLCNLASILTETGDFISARRSYLTAVDLARSVGSTATLVSALSGAAGLTSDSTEAISLMTEACDLVSEARLGLLADEDRTDLLSQQGGVFAFLAYLKIQSDDLDGAFEAMERVRGLGLADLITAQELRDASTHEALREEEAAWLELEREWVADVPMSDAKATALSAAQDRLRRAQTRLRTSFPVLTSAALVSATPASLDAALGSHSAFLGYTFVGDQHMILHCVTDERNHVVVIEEGSEIQQLALQAAVANDLPRDEHLYALYQALIGPVEESIGDRELVIAADGALHQVPFAALLTEPPGGPSKHAWLVRRNPIRLIPSASVLVDLAGRVSVDYVNRLVVFADASYDEVVNNDLEFARRIVDGDVLPDLPFAREEAYRIAAVSSSRTPPQGDNWDEEGIAMRIGKYATRREFERIAPMGARWLHVACHGLVDPAHPWASRVVLAHDGTNNPHLTAAVVLRRRLPADLVVLSCCSTGLGRVVPGEGVLGLSRAFLAAGARSVCATLWPVLDAAGPPLMERMYTSLNDGGRPSEALRSAQLALADIDAPPSQWAGYCVIG
jgi:CHAT domain-containing protein/tetratricopeptide (TPR) repeat protein